MTHCVMGLWVSAYNTQICSLTMFNLSHPYLVSLSFYTMLFIYLLLRAMEKLL